MATANAKANPNSNTENGDLDPLWQNLDWYAQFTP